MCSRFQTASVGFSASRLICCLIVLCYPAFSIAQQSAASEPSEQALAEISATIDSVQAEIDKRLAERSSLYKTLQESEQSLVRINAEIRRLGNSIQDNEDRLNQYRKERAELEKLKVGQQRLLRQYLRSAHLAGKQEYFKLLLNQEDPALASRNLQYYRYFSNARAARVKDYSETIRNIQETEARISTTQNALTEQQQSLQARQQALQDTADERQSLLDDLDLMLSSSNQKLEALEAERVEMEFLLEELRQSIANLSLGDQQQPFAELKGQLQWPVEGRIVNRFGGSTGLGDLDWQGITIAASEGNDVKAIHHGRVVFSDWFSTSGLLLIIDHGDGYMSLYAHNQVLYKEVGEWVSSGETIAAVGNTGGQQDSSLYFEIRHNGESRNPSAWCVARN